MRLAMYVSMCIYTYESLCASIHMKRYVCTEQVNIRSLSIRLAMYVPMCIYTYDKVSLHRAGEHKIYVDASSYVGV